MNTQKEEITQQQYDNIKKWIAELRSGKHSQTTDVMYNPNTDSHCCLGVLVEHVIGAKYDHECEGYLTKVNEETQIAEYLPSSVFIEHHIGIKGHYDFLCQLTKDMAPRQFFSYLNDDLDYTFEDIADVLERILNNHVTIATT